MKNSIITTIALLLTFSATAFGKNVLKVEKADGVTHLFEVEDIERIYFDEEEDLKPTEGKFVDLGLSVRWATANYGAENPEESGNYYSWGEKNPKSSYSGDNYEYPPILFDNIISDVLRYDPKLTNGGRIPLKEEFNELILFCKWRWTRYNNVPGYMVTGPNGNSIFLPAKGYKSGDELIGDGFSAKYWSGDKDSSTSHSGYDAYSMKMDSSETPSLICDAPYQGLMIRPVEAENIYSYSCRIIKEKNEITETTATIRAFADKYSTYYPYANGMVISTTPGFDDSSYIESDKRGPGEFSVTFKGLKAGTTYYYCPAIRTQGFLATLSTESFTTKEYHGKQAEAVDLGLSVKWASHNLGAASRNEKGDLFAWGESEFNKEEFSSFNHDEIYYSDISKYDAASLLWGNGWRMPTSEEIEELLEKCTFMTGDNNNVEGFYFIGPNGNSIFIPMTDVIQSNATNSGIEKVGQYWTSSYDESDYEKKQAFIVNMSIERFARELKTKPTYFGLPIRPVKD